MQVTIPDQKDDIMSDDTPTQRLPEPGDAPTERLSTTDVQEDLVEEKQRSRGLLIGLIIAGALLLVAILVLVFMLGRATGQPGDPQVVDTSSATPEPTDEATPEPTDEATPEPTDEATSEPSPTPSKTQEPAPPQEPEQPQPPAGPAVTKFEVSTKTVYCNTQAPNPSHQYISFSWKTSNGSQIYFGVDTGDASAAPLFTNLPPNGKSQYDFPTGYTDFEFGCPNASHKYTLTVVDANGKKASKSVTVTNKGDLQ